MALAWLPAALYMGLIWVVSSQHVTSAFIHLFPFADKGVHFCEYLLLGLLVSHASLRTWPDRAVVRTAVLGILVAFAWGVLDELHQAFVPGRDADVLDVVADALGAITGAGMRALVAGLARKREVA